MAILTIPPERTEDMERVRDLLFDTLGNEPWSEAEYLAYANRFARLVEYLDGKVVILDMPTPNHQRLVLRLYDCLQAWAVGHGAETLVAPMPVRLGPGHFREPDVMLYAADRRSAVKDQFGGPPDLVVEVLSPGTARQDSGAKMLEYAAAGIPEYWLVDPQRRELVLHTLSAERYGPGRTVAVGDQADSTRLHGLRCAVADLFRDLD
jgi:Uma2 family endonuclease